MTDYTQQAQGRLNQELQDEVQAEIDAAKEHGDADPNNELPKPTTATSTPEDERSQFAELVAILNAEDQDDPDTVFTILSTEEYDKDTFGTDTPPEEPTQ